VFGSNKTKGPKHPKSAKVTNAEIK